MVDGLSSKPGGAALQLSAFAAITKSPSKDGKSRSSKLRSRFEAKIGNRWHSQKRQILTFNPEFAVFCWGR